jgi:dihydroorotate dehydrogenase electron transfer subunit
MMYRVVEIEEIVDETPTIKTFFFEDESKPKPGQFYMIWLPGIDEFPMSISYIGKRKGFTVKRIGAGTNKMHSLREGDKLWIRGPYGRGFEIIDKRALIIGGGSGMATLGPLMDRVNGDVLIAARTKEELLFTERFERGNTYIATDDGSAGFKGFATELAEILLNKENYDIIYTCGPEIMMRKIIDMALERSIRIQASLERLMKCGIGICDSCTINGYRVCIDGPVFTEKELKEMRDLGRYERDASGRRVQI